VDLQLIAKWLRELGAAEQLIEQARQANTAQEILELSRGAGVPLAHHVVQLALECARKTLQSGEISLNVVVVTRDGTIAANTANDP
jgi:cobalt-precorrin-5B (C1)-methyltransferase